MSRKQFFMPGELPLVLLALLDHRPQGGYELLGELARRFAPHYRPSPGSVYPALAALRAEALIEHASGLAEGVHRPTRQGLELLAEKAPLLAQIEGRTATELARSASLAPALARLTARVDKLSGSVDRRAVEGILDRAALAIADLQADSDPA